MPSKPAQSSGPRPRGPRRRAGPTVADVLHELAAHDGRTNAGNSILINQFLTCPDYRLAVAMLAVVLHKSHRHYSTRVLETPRGGWLPPVV